MYIEAEMFTQLGIVIVGFLFMVGLKSLKLCLSHWPAGKEMIQAIVFKMSANVPFHNF